jgi:hypothetical protein
MKSQRMMSDLQALDAMDVEGLCRHRQRSGCNMSVVRTIRRRDQS